MAITQFWRLTKIIAVACALASCSQPLRISPQQFQAELCPPQANSAWDAEYVGVKDGKVYLKYWSAKPEILGGGTRLHWVPIEQLPPTTAANPDLLCRHR
jgi:hypothetical protein